MTDGQKADRRAAAYIAAVRLICEAARIRRAQLVHKSTATAGQFPELDYRRWYAEADDVLTAMLDTGGIPTGADAATTGR